jgi:hypothetical protein
MMIPNQRTPMPGPARQRPLTEGGPGLQAPGSQMTRPFQRSVLSPEQTFARPFSQIGSPGSRLRTQFPPVL